MIKPENADKGEDYWMGKIGIFGYSAIGDDAVLIRPNYPDIFDIRDRLRKIGYKEAEVEPFDVYRGPYVDTGGVEAGESSLRLSRITNNCRIWYTEIPDVYSLECGRYNKKLLGSDEPYLGDKEVIIDKLKDIKNKLL